MAVFTTVALIMDALTMRSPTTIITHIDRTTTTIIITHIQTIIMIIMDGKYMRPIIYSICLFIALLCVFCLGDGKRALDSGARTVEYVGNGRPFSFYYPYNYEYYYPRPEYRPSAHACYWVYVNGMYVYYCE